MPLGSCSSDQSHLPWNEKYRPQRLNDVHAQTSIIHLFQRMVEQNRPMHLLFHGPPGTGKTSTIRSFCKEIYSPEKYEHCVMSINASYDRGIDMVRTKIKPFCKKSMSAFDYKEHRITYKIIILDEADTLTQEAQNALRRCIEVFSYNTRFCFLCNYISKIISPIMSRCLCQHFKPLPEESVVACLKGIAAKEGMTVDDEKFFHEVFAECRGDMRSCVTMLEQAHSMYGTTVASGALERHSKSAVKFWIGAYDKLTLHQYATEIRKSGISCKELTRQFVDRVLMQAEYEEGSENESTIYRYCISLSCIEKQLLHVTDTMSIIYMLVSWYKNIQQCVTN